MWRTEPEGVEAGLQFLEQPAQRYLQTWKDGVSLGKPKQSENGPTDFDKPWLNIQSADFERQQNITNQH